VFQIGSVIRCSFPFTTDYQLIANRTCNADRASVSIFSGRLHGNI
jgi:hypothetical protein